MIVCWRNTDPEEAAFFELVARESGIPSGLCTQPVESATCTRVVTCDGVVTGFYRLAWQQPCPHRDIAELDYLHVYAHYRRTGLGHSLLRDLHRTAAQLELSRVRIVAHPPAAGFFATAGACRVTTEPPADSVSWSRPVFEIACTTPTGGQPLAPATHDHAQIGGTVSLPHLPTRRSHSDVVDSLRT